MYKELFVFVTIAFFNGSLNFTVAATWKTMFTLSINKFLSLEDRPKSGRLISPFIKWILFKIPGFFFCISSNNWKIYISDSITGNSIFSGKYIYFVYSLLQLVCISRNLIYDFQFFASLENMLNAIFPIFTIDLISHFISFRYYKLINIDTIFTQFSKRCLNRCSMDTFFLDRMRM